MQYLKILFLVMAIVPGLAAPAFSFGGSFFGGVSRGQLEERVLYVGSIAELEAVSVAGLKPDSVYLEARGGGVFVWSGSDLSAEVAADMYQAIYIAPAGDSTGASGAWVRKHSGVLNVEWFGALPGDGVDDSAEVQAAVDFGLPVVFGPGVFNLSASVTVSSNGQLIESGSTWQSEFSEATQIIFSQDGPGFIVEAPQVSFKGLKITGPTTASPLSVAIAAAIPSTNTDDMDLYVIDCYLEKFYKGVTVQGRGFASVRNLFFSMNTGIESSWPSAGTVGTGEQALPLGYRAYRVQGNRFHAVSTCIKTTGANSGQFRGAIISGNQSDIGEGFFAGGITDSLISNNIIDQSSSTPIYIDSGGTGVVIANNTLQGTDGDAAQSPGNAIWYAAGAVAENVSIVGNSIRYIDNAAIRFQANVSQVSIVGNIFTDLNQSGGAYECIDVNGVTVTDSTFLANVFNSGSWGLLYGTPTDGGGNVIQEGGGLLIGSLSGDRKLEVTDAGPFLAEFIRSGSTGGVNIGFTNDNGTLNIGVVPTGANAGSFVPGADNAVGLGSGSLKWGDIFVDLPTSDPLVSGQLWSDSGVVKVSGG